MLVQCLPPIKTIPKRLIQHLTHLQQMVVTMKLTEKTLSLLLLELDTKFLISNQKVEVEDKSENAEKELILFL